MCRGDEYWRVGFVEEGLCARRVWSGEGGLLRTEKGKQEIKTEKGYLCTLNASALVRTLACIV